MSCKVTCCYCILTIIFVVIFFGLWLGKLIGIISIENEYQLLWKNKNKYFAHHKKKFQSSQMQANLRVCRPTRGTGRTRKVNSKLNCETNQPCPHFANQNAGRAKTVIPNYIGNVPFKYYRNNYITILGWTFA